MFFIENESKLKYTKNRLCQSTNIAFCQLTIKTPHPHKPEIISEPVIQNIFSDYFLGLIPKYQITVRDYKSGFSMVGYSFTKDSTSIGIFVAYVVYCLQKCGTDTTTLHFQSDNGSDTIPRLKCTSSLRAQQSNPEKIIFHFKRGIV